MTVKEFAQRAEISKSLAYRLIDEGRVGHQRIGQRGKRGKIILSEQDVRESLKLVEVEAG